MRSPKELVGKSGKRKGPRAKLLHSTFSKLSDEKILRMALFLEDSVLRMFFRVGMFSYVNAADRFRSLCLILLSVFAVTEKYSPATLLNYLGNPTDSLLDFICTQLYCL